MKFETLKQNSLDGIHRSGTCIYVQPGLHAGGMNGAKLTGEIKKALDKNNMTAEVIETGSFGLFDLEPMMWIAKEGRPKAVYVHITRELIAAAIQDYIAEDGARAPFAAGTIGEPSAAGIPNFFDLPFFKEQKRIVLRNCGLIDPANIDSYIAAGGYAALEKALNMTSDAIAAEIGKSRLLGRVSGLPVTQKWSDYKEEPNAEKILVCNAYESGCEASGMRMLLEGDPHTALEGMLIAAYATGAKKGFIYISEADLIAIERIKTALAQMAGKGLLGEKILDHDFNFTIELYIGQNGVVRGEETAMIRALAGEPPMPFIQIPKSPVLKLNDMPVLVHNAETLANLPQIILNGAEWFAGIGDDLCKGTKIFTLTGKLANKGVVEIPLGMPLNHVIQDIAGGMAGQKEAKSIILGGSLGVCTVPQAEIPLTYHNAEAVIYTGVINALDSDDCMIDQAKDMLKENHLASCGKCVMCREGTYQLQRILADITEGKAKADDIALMEEICSGMKAVSICGFGRVAPNIVISSLKHFREEYEMHISRKRCPALVCKKFITYHILGEKCQGCGKCMEACPSEAIMGENGMIHVIDQYECTKCGKCLEVCPIEYSAVVKAGAVKPKTPEEPIPVGTWKKR